MKPSSMKKSAPLFSIIIATYHCSQKLLITLKSVVGEPAEIIVVDGGLDEKTGKVVESFGDRIRCISEADEGIYDALNKGIRSATGCYLLFLGTGDQLRAGVLKKIAKILPNHTDSFVYGNAFMHDKGVIWDGPWNSQKFRKRNICQQAIFYGRSVFDQVGYFETKFRILADYAMNIRCFGAENIQKIYVNEIISDYEGFGVSSRIRDTVFYEERATLLKEHLGV